MKIFEINIPFNHNLATLRPTQDKENEFFWDNWNITDNIITDFIPSYYDIIGRSSCLECLHKKFKGIGLVDITIVENPLEKKSKNKNRLKWLPKEVPNLKKISIIKQVPLNSESTVSYDEDGYIDEIIGIEELIGNKIKKREQGKGLFINRCNIGDFSLFTIQNTSYPLCTEEVKQFCESQNYKNIIFLEVGEIV